MKEFNGTALETVIKIPLKRIFRLFRDGEYFGHLIAEETSQGGKHSTIFTPFTSDGLLDETRCFKCAIKSLIKFHEKSGAFQPCDRRRPSVEFEIHVISLGRPQLH